MPYQQESRRDQREYYPNELDTRRSREYDGRAPILNQGPPPHHMGHAPPMASSAHHPDFDPYDNPSSGSRPPPPPMAAPGRSSLNAPAGRPMSAPSQSVIFLGLPANVDDVILRTFLEDLGASIDTTTIIYDKESGTSKRFGFARFASVEHARSFVEPNFPSVVWRDRTGRGNPVDDGLRVKIDYSQTDRVPRTTEPSGPHANPSAASHAPDQRRMRASMCSTFYNILRGSIELLPPQSPCTMRAYQYHMYLQHRLMTEHATLALLQVPFSCCVASIL